MGSSSSRKESYEIMDVPYLEEVLRSPLHDFSAKYMAAGELERICAHAPGAFSGETVSVLEATLRDPRHRSQTQSLFFYKRIAGLLSAIIRTGKGGKVRGNAFQALERLLTATDVNQHLAACEALGSLPVSIEGPRPEEIAASPFPEVSWEEVCGARPFEGEAICRPQGRSLVISCEGCERVLVVKMARAGEKPESLIREAFWMEKLRRRISLFEERFEIPEPFRFHGRHVFRLLRPLTGPDPIPAGVHPERYALAFTVHSDYFVYPNHPGPQGPLPPTLFRETMLRCAYLLGRMSGLGLVHTAPLTLFHNRIQRSRREDGGVYLWQRAGRLDRWLASCRYPNFGLSGVRDFEHVVPVPPRPAALYDLIGIHFLGLLLAAGSYFRFKEPEKIGLDERGRPWDVRHLFDGNLLRELIEGIFRRYYEGFSGAAWDGNPPVDAKGLAARMIEEMGVDRHMEEILRVQDQERMTDEEFREFLLGRGFDPGKIADTKRGAADITLLTGPHLGRFTEAFSLPELTRCVATYSALCIGGRHRREQRAEADQDF